MYDISSMQIWSVATCSRGPVPAPTSSSFLCETDPTSAISGHCKLSTTSLLPLLISAEASPLHSQEEEEEATEEQEEGAETAQQSIL